MCWLFWCQRRVPTIWLRNCAAVCENVRPGCPDGLPSDKSVSGLCADLLDDLRYQTRNLNDIPRSWFFEVYPKWNGGSVWFDVIALILACLSSEWFSYRPSGYEIAQCAVPYAWLQSFCSSSRCPSISKRIWPIQTRRISTRTEFMPLRTMRRYLRSCFMTPNAPSAWIERFTRSRAPCMLSRFSRTSRCILVSSSLIRTVRFLGVRLHFPVHHGNLGNWQNRDRQKEHMTGFTAHQSYPLKPALYLRKLPNKTTRFIKTAEHFISCFLDSILNSDI